MNKKGDILFGKIIHICIDGLTVLTNKKYVFEIPKKNVTDWAWKNLFNEFKLRDNVNFIVEEIDNENKTGIGNFKANHSYFARSPFVEELKETKHGFKNLKKSIDTEVIVWDMQNNRS
ncbi:RNA-binding protein [Mycoplasma sp. ES3157-GEN-MYC]|uniref:RNA-binding protein n=1 Tax=Mycoplasma miroungigenitalium TaxID=754515 RepID=A0A6M4JA71_9MOLU|nr:RNA-binding protein [Mycoplasma miroungigenitalium]MBU4690189.1 RNA-binding protein [Mycoplasma miroungigenitalium]MBU4691460.1 RNA-binding protein [Mycoplasma miroungigenitalium]QJR43295.1 RNA-binding protein [Mycoplasma miroungigenitalium]